MAEYGFLNLDENAIESIESLWGMEMPNMVKLSFSYNRLISMKVMRKLALPLLDQLQLDHNYLLQEDGFAEGRYLAHIKIWIYFGEVTIEKKKVNKCIDAKLHPIKLNF